MDNNSLLRNKIDNTLNKMIEDFYHDAPHGSYQKDSNDINLSYYVRHTIETVLRIRHKRMIDALVIHHFTKHNPRLAKDWAHYTEDEMLHGHMFARDIEKLSGLKIDDIYNNYQPLFSTQLLNGYFYFTLEHEGPLAAITSAYFLEYTTRMTQPIWLDNLEKILGKDNLLGARGHVNHDIRDNHNDFVWNVLSSLIHSKEDEERLFLHLQRIYSLFVAYFLDVYNETIGKNNEKHAVNLACLAIKTA